MEIEIEKSVDFSYKSPKSLSLVLQETISRRSRLWNSRTMLLISEMSETIRIKEGDVLPLELIHRIQSLLSLKKAASTRILSKSWLHAWYTIPTLRIREPSPNNWFSTCEKAIKYNNFIRTTLQRYHRDNMPIESFHLHINITGYLRLEDVKNWIRLAVSRSCLKELRLNIRVSRNETLILPSEIFSCQNLHVIWVAHISSDRGNLQLPFGTNPRVINCVSLRTLDLSQVIITADMFHNLLSKCTLLEKIKLWCCKGFKKIKVKNLLHLSELEITSCRMNDLWEINNVPRLCSLHYRALGAAWMKPIPFQIDSLATVTQLCIKGVIIDNSFFDTLEAKFPVLESLTLGIEYWKPENLVITSDSLKWLTLGLCCGRHVNVQVNAPRLLSFIYTGNIPGLLFRTTAPEQVKLTFDSWDNFGHSYFLEMREALNLSSKFDINITSNNLDYVVSRNIDVDDLRRRVLFPVGNVELTLETRLDEHVWEQSRFFDALFLICHPTYIRSSYQVIRKMMIGNTSDLKEVLFKNPHNEKWEALTSSWISVLHTFPDHVFECKLNWFPQ